MGSIDVKSLGADTSSLASYVEVDNTGSLTGAVTTTTIAPIVRRLIGDVVFLSISIGSLSKTAAASPETMTHTGDGSLPATVKPGSAQDFPVLVENGGTLQWGVLTVATSGRITIYADTAKSSFGITSTNGIPYDINIFYSVA